MRTPKFGTTPTNPIGVRPLPGGGVAIRWAYVAMVVIGITAAATAGTAALFGCALAIWGGARFLSDRPTDVPTIVQPVPQGRDALLACLRHLNDKDQLEASVLLLAQVDNVPSIEELHGHDAAELVLAGVGAAADQLIGPGDLTIRLDSAAFAIVIPGNRRAELQEVVQLTARLQRSLDCVSVDGGPDLRPTISIGIAMASKVESLTPDALVLASTRALAEARRQGPGAIRSYSSTIRKRIDARNLLCHDVSEALLNGDISAFFQPQIDLSTGAVTGFETLARWHHKTRGLVSPADFLPALRQADRMGALGDLMVISALDALCHWDSQGFDVPRVGVNFSTAELSDPQLVDRIAHLLDARDLEPGRLVIEVLETVVAQSDDDTVTRNLSGLARLGCGIDLDDFGTGYASITNIRKLSIERIKIDRSFVANIDSDEEQQNMVAAILTMADKLGLETLAEGVETPAEQAMLLGLGCGYAQGFLFARPQPLTETDAWLRSVQTQGQPLVPFRRRVG